jgi:hypothetical protein
MLDYDSMRSKVRKLVEKPDKDPSKLPRTEKEAEMVIQPLIIDLHNLSCSSPAKGVDFPSPPKVLENIRRKPIHQHQQRDLEEENATFPATTLRRSSSIYNTVNRVGSLVGNALARTSPTPTEHDEWALPPLSPPVRASGRETLSSLTFNLPPARKPVCSPTSPSEMKKLRLLNQSSPSRRPIRKPQAMVFPDTTSEKMRKPSLKTSIDTPRIQITTTPARTIKSTPFFHPSELEDIMQPLKREFVQRQADLCAQAKAAYEQLNQQLTDELPQLIDLRYVC